MTWRIRLVGLLAELLDVDLKRTFQTTEYVPYVEHVPVVETEYVPYVEHIPVIETEWKDPIEELKTLPDEHGNVYCWLVNTEPGAKQVTNILETYFQDTLGRDPKAAHIVLTDVEQLRELDPEELSVYTKPFDT